MFEELIALAAAFIDRADGAGLANSADLLAESKLVLSLAEAEAAAASIASRFVSSRRVCLSHLGWVVPVLFDSRLSTGECAPDAKLGVGESTTGRVVNLLPSPSALHAKPAADFAPGVSVGFELGRRTFSRDEVPDGLLVLKVLFILRLFGLGDLDCLMLGTGDASDGILAACRASGEGTSASPMTACTDDVLDPIDGLGGNAGLDSSV